MHSVFMTQMINRERAGDGYAQAIAEYLSNNMQSTAFLWNCERMTLKKGELTPSRLLEGRREECFTTSMKKGKYNKGNLKNTSPCHSRMFLSGIQRLDARLNAAGMTRYFF